MTQAVAPSTQRRITYDEYRALPERTTKCELVYGELREEMTGANTAHQRTLGHLFILLSGLPTRREMGEFFMAPFDVRLADDLVYQPDILFVAHGGRAAIGDKEVNGPPDLVVEIISPTSRRIDRKEKFSNYAKHGVREYWLVHPDAALVEIFVLREEQFRLLGRFGGNEAVQSEVLAGIQFTAEAIFEE
jgi:Uma2 family endonuclease